MEEFVCFSPPVIWRSGREIPKLKGRVGSHSEKHMPRGSDFFSASQSLEPGQIKAYLQSPDPFLQTVAIKHITAQMTLGKDMSPHFTDVAQHVRSSDLQIKKLVYVYLMQNAKSQPEKAVLLAGTFMRDASHSSPLIRGTAVRTMASMQVPAMLSFSQDAVAKCLRDADPYVRRNAAVGALKLHHVSPTLLEETGIMHQLMDLLSDSVAAVVATAACVLSEIAAKDKNERVEAALAGCSGTLMAALSESAEWSHLYLLRAVSRSFKIWTMAPGWSAAARLGDGETIAQRTLPFLQSSNAAVVLAAVRVILAFLTVFCSSSGSNSAAGATASTLAPLQQADLEKRYVTKIAQPLISLLSGVRPEIRYVTLRHLRIIVQRYRDPFLPFVPSLYVKFDDAIYVKLEKVEVLLALATKQTAEAILAEFAEYTKEVDQELVRRTVRATGVLAVKQPSAAPQCVERLVKLIESKVPYIVQEAAIVVQNVLRQYPTEYEGIIVTLCNAMAVLEDPESKAAMIWVVGEYAERITNSVDILNQFFELFQDEPLSVQLAVLTATVKIFLAQKASERSPAKQAALEKVLALSTNSAVPDLRDRAHIYWRLILADPATAIKVVRAEKDRIVELGAFDRLVVNELLQDVGALSCVIHRPAAGVLADDKRSDKTILYEDADECIDEEARARAAAAIDSGVAGSVIPATRPDADDDDAYRGAAAIASSSAAAVPRAPRTQLTTVLDPAGAGKGLEVKMCWAPGAPLPLLKIQFSWMGGTATGPSGGGAAIPVITISLLQLNANRYSIGLGQEFPVIELKSPASPAAAATTNGSNTSLVTLLLNCNNAKKPITDIQVAMRVEPLGVMYFVAPPLDPSLVFGPAPPSLEPSVYAQEFQQLAVTWVLPTETVRDKVPRVRSAEAATNKSFLKTKGLLLVYCKVVESLVGMHLFTVSISGARFFAEVTLEHDAVVVANVKSTEPLLSGIFGEFVIKVLTSA